MVTHFDRSAVQEFFEGRVGCTNPGDFPGFLGQVVALKLSFADANLLVDKVRADIQGQFERSALSLVQAITDIDAGNRMWASVKLYYSVFYALRVELHLNGMSIVRCNRVFTSNGKQGTSLKRYNNAEKGDHGIAISLAMKNLANSDILLGASIDGTTTYLWMKTLREIVQYKMRNPPETFGFDPFFPSRDMSISDQIKMFIADTDPYFCFDPDYAALAIPIKRFQVTAAHVRNEGISLSKAFKSIIDTAFNKSASVALLKPMIW